MDALRLVPMLPALVLAVAHPALADHGGPLRDAPMSPVTVGVLSGGLALLVGILVVVVVGLLGRKDDSAGE